MVYRACLRASPGADAGRTALAKLSAVSAASETRQFLGRAGDGEAAQPAGHQLAGQLFYATRGGIDEFDREDQPSSSARDDGAAPSNGWAALSDFRAGAACDAG